MRVSDRHHLVVKSSEGPLQGTAEGRLIVDNEDSARLQDAT
jgi:hypothetical protein